MSVSTTLSETLVTTSPESEVSVVVDSNTQAVVSVDVGSEATIIAQTPAKTVLTPSQDIVAQILADTPSETTVSVVDDIVMINTTVVAPAEIITPTAELVQIAVLQDTPVQLITQPDIQVTVATVESTNAIINVVEAPVIELSVAVERTNIIETAAEQGPAGPQGIAGPPGGVSFYATNEALAAHKIAAMKPDSSLTVADCTQFSSLGYVVGVTSQSWLAGSQVTLSQNGIIVDNNGWTFTPGTKVFVGINGELTQTLPANAVFYQAVGTMLTATKLLINIEAPIILN